MSKKVQKLFSKKVAFLLKLFFRKFPSIPYVLKWTVICLFIGLCIGSASAGFLISLDWATHFREEHLWLIILLPVSGFIIGLLYYYFGKEIESGNNFLIDVIHQSKQTTPFRMAPFIYLSTIVTHFFGGSAGREGTALQLAGAIADQFTKPFKLTAPDRSALMIAAIAGGFSSVFGTPLAGALLGLEFYHIGRIRYNAIFPALMTAIIADQITKLWGVHHTQYHISLIPDMSFLNIVYAIIAGAFFGLCAATFNKVIHETGNLFKSKIDYPPLRPLLGGIIVVLGVGIMGTTKYIGLGIPTIISSFEVQLPAYDFLLKMMFTIITLAAGFKGGEVTPLFFIGATLGNALSYFIPLPISLLAGMGFVAVFAGSANTPIACIIMAIELFGVECGPFVAIACVVAYLLSGHTSIYGKQVIGDPKNQRFSNHKGKRINEL